MAKADWSLWVGAPLVLAGMYFGGMMVLLAIALPYILLCDFVGVHPGLPIAAVVLLICVWPSRRRVKQTECGD